MDGWMMAKTKKMIVRSCVGGGTGIWFYMRSIAAPPFYTFEAILKRMLWIMIMMIMRERMGYYGMLILTCRTVPMIYKCA